jgi:Ca2+-binding EF-hand superfamily protein
MPPVGVSPQVATLFMQGSQIFRSADVNWSGSLDKREWKRAMMMMGITFSKHEAKHLFYTADTDRSGRISEREFCEFLVWMNHHRTPHMYPALW